MLCAVQTFLVLTAVSAMAVPGFTQTIAQTASIDQEVPGLLEQHNVPSVSIAEIEDGRIVRVSAYGMQTASEPATPKTLYNIASMTKPISAETELRLIWMERSASTSQSTRFGSTRTSQTIQETSC